MKNAITYAILFVVAVGCSFDGLGVSQNFKSFGIYLNNSSQRSTCSNDSIDVVFIIKNLSQSSSLEVKVSVKAGDIKFANVDGTKDESINIKVLSARDSTVLFNEDKKIGKTVVVGGDVTARNVTFCGDQALKFEHFEE